MKLEITKYGHPVLREKATRVDKVDDRIRQLADDMLETMYAGEGIGLAAQQVAATVSLCVVDVPSRCDLDDEDEQPLNPDVPMPLTLINPEVLEASEETEVYEEGCLSFPDIRAPVERPFEIVVRFLNRDGAPEERRVRGLLARCIQHELDHLHGVLLVDRMSAVKRIALSGRLKRLRRETQEHLL